MFGALAGPATAAKKPKAPKPVAVYPVAGTKFVSNATTISFRGINPKRLKLSEIKVTGSKTGVHKGEKLRHSDGRGVSFVPKKKFAKREWIRVQTNLRITGARKGDFRYKVADLTTRDDKPLNPEIPPITDGLHSRPDLKPEKLEVTAYEPGVAPGNIFYAPKQDGLAIADNAGRTTWWQPTNFDVSGVTFYNFRTQKYNGRPVLTYWRGASSVTGYAQIGTFEILNRKYEKIASFKPGNGYKADIHEFQMTPRNTALVLSYVGVSKDLSKVGGAKNGRLLDNVVQEVDIKTGAVLFEWHSAGNIPINTGVGQVPEDRSSFDYFHANSIQVDGDGYLVSSRRQSSIYRIHRKNGTIHWALSGTGNSRNDFQMGPGTEFGYQHDAQRLPNGDISMFDNSNGRFEPPVYPESSALVLRLSGKGKKRKATLVKRYTHPGDGVVSASQGNAEPLANGNFFVGWGQPNLMTEFNAAGDVVFDASHTGTIIPDLGVASSYRAYKAPWSGIPQGKPAIAVDSTGTKVWASWNGSQATAKWEVLTGADASSVAKVAELDWADFETEIATPALGAVTVVRALDKTGKELGRSAAVAPGGQNSGQDVPTAK
ncbi:MAG: arylsulfotransferase family protein [Solirubrobacterales bacterium]